MWGRQQLPFAEQTPAEVKARMDGGENVLLIDVREPVEHRLAAVAGAELRPMSEAGAWIDDLPRDRPLVIMCHHGVRSAQVAMALVQRGYTDVANMVGGIDRWAREVDPQTGHY